MHDDYDLERPSVELKTSKPLPRGYTPSDYEVYDYPGLYIQKPDGEQYASVRIDELGTQFETAQAATNARGLTVGALLTLEHHTRDDQNREYLIAGASYDLSFEDYESLPEAGGTGYRCAFVAMPSGAAVPAEADHAEAVRAGPADRGRRRAGRRGDLHRQVRPGEGAVPLGPARQEGREQLVLDPRVAPVGRQELGRDRDAAHRPGSDRRLPRRRSRSADHHRPRLQRRADAAVRPAGEQDAVGRQEPQLEGRRPANFNEIRFEDKKGSEQLFIHAEKNQDIEVENDETHWVGHDRTKTIDHDETTHIKHDRTETVDNNETITIGVNRTETVDKNETITIT